MKGERKLLVKLCNNNRNKRGLRALKSNVALNRSAQAKARHLARTDNLSHGRWWPLIEKIAKKLGERRFGWLAENIGYDDKAVDVDRNWRNSPDHAANYFSKQGRFIGVGRAVSKRTGRVYYVQHFAGRK